MSLTGLFKKNEFGFLTNLHSVTPITVSIVCPEFTNTQLSLHSDFMASHNEAIKSAAHSISKRDSTANPPNAFLLELLPLVLKLVGYKIKVKC